jgi:hypothetical protein
MKERSGSNMHSPADYDEMPKHQKEPNANIPRSDIRLAHKNILFLSK